VRRAGGAWSAHVRRVGGPPLLEHDPDRVVHGYSVQKLAVAVAVLDKVDRGRLRLGQTVEVTPESVLGGSGLYHLNPVWGDHVTLATVLTSMLLVSDNTAVRLCAQVAPAAEVNAILAAKGFEHTRVEPVARPDRFLLGTTTARETTELLLRLASGTLLSPASSAYVLTVLRSLSGYHDGVRRTMSSAERSRVATKHGADFDASGAARHEAGLVFAVSGQPALGYAFFATGLGDRGNYGATHPAVRAHAVLGRHLLAAASA
jgi:beta-lactamase class A